MTTTEWGERVNTNSPPCDWCCLAVCKLPMSCCSSRGGEIKRRKAKERGKKIEEECNPPAWLRETGWREESDISPLLTAPPHPPHLNPSPGPIMHSEKCFRHPQQTGALPEETDSNQSQSQGQTWSCMLGNTREMMHNDLYALKLWEMEISNSYL